jgi:hypothetical protein
MIVKIVQNLSALAQKWPQQMIVPKYQLSTGADLQNDGATDWDLQDDAIIEKVGCQGAQRTQRQ